MAGERGDRPRLRRKVLSANGHWVGASRVTDMRGWSETGKELKGRGRYRRRRVLTAGPVEREALAEAAELGLEVRADWGQKGGSKNRVLGEREKRRR